MRVHVNKSCIFVSKIYDIDVDNELFCRQRNFFFCLRKFSFAYENTRLVRECNLCVTWRMRAYEYATDEWNVCMTWRVRAYESDTDESTTPGWKIQWSVNDLWISLLLRCSVLQRVAVRCSVLQCVAVCCSVLQ